MVWANGENIKALLEPNQAEWPSQGKEPVPLSESPAVLAMAFERNTIFTWESAWQANHGVSDWVFGRHFCKDEPTEPVTSKGNNQQYLILSPVIEIRALWRKLECWKTSICHHNLDSFLILKNFLRRTAWCWECGFLILYNKTCQIWKIWVTH